MILHETDANQGVPLPSFGNVKVCRDLERGQTARNRDDRSRGPFASNRDHRRHESAIFYFAEARI